MERQEFFDMFAPAAMEQQKKYGIPASITLAQMLLESGGGSSRLAREGNNFFGIKKHGWTGDVVHADDDRPNEAFRKYDSIMDSVEDHSKFLMQKRYAKCHELSSTDYEGWAKGLKAAGYATDSKYADSLIKIIECYKLDRYDWQAKTEAEKEGLSCGEKRETLLKPPANGASIAFGMPLRNNDELVITSDFGHRNVKGGSTEHEGIDLRASKGTAVYATEGNGIVLKTGYDKGSNGKVGGGNYLYVAYPRPDGSYRVAGYLHLNEINVKAGDRVDANTVLGKSGNSGGANLGAHLDFRVAKVTGADAQEVAEHISKEEYGAARNTALGAHQGAKYGNFIDAKEYLAEIALAGGLSTKMVKKGDATKHDVLADVKQKANKDDVSLLARKGAAEDPEALDHDISGSMGQQTSLSNDGKSKNEVLANLMQQMFSGSMDLFGTLFGLSVAAYLSMANGKSKEEKQSAIISIKKDLKGESHDDESSYTVDMSGKKEKSIDTDYFIVQARNRFDLEYDRIESIQNQEQSRGIGI